MYDYYAVTAVVCILLLVVWLLRYEKKREPCEQYSLYRDLRKIQTLTAALVDTNANLSEATRSIGTAARKLRDESIGLMRMYAYLPEGEQRTRLFSALEHIERSCNDLIVKVGSLESTKVEGGGEMTEASPS